jgi:hypothetical protein
LEAGNLCLPRICKRGFNLNSRHGLADLKSRAKKRI